MLDVALARNAGLGEACRIGPLARHEERLAAREIAALLAAGALAAVAVAFIAPGLRIPGSAIVRAALPMVCGVALVPRRFAGSTMAVGAAITALAISVGGFAGFQAGALTSLLTLGPAIDLAMTGVGAAAGPWVYARFALAGVLANSMAFAARAGASMLALDAVGSHHAGRFGAGAFLSYAACGAAAGLLGAILFFRARPR
jgi:hypothetical protein